MIKRLAIFQADWPLQSQTTNMITVLTGRGWHVDLWLYRVDTWFVGLDPDDLGETVRVFDWSAYPLQSGRAVEPAEMMMPGSDVRQRIKSWLLNYPHLFRLWKSGRDRQYMLLDRFDALRAHNDLDYVLPQALLGWTDSILAKQRYRCLIGVEKTGLIWAGVMGEKYSIPSVYFSLELYLDDDFPFAKDRTFHRIRRLEAKYHRQTAATIIQDATRGHVLRASTGASQSDLLFVPVSLLGEPDSQKSQYLHDLLGIPTSKRIILYFGQLRARRFVHQLVAVAQSFPEDWVLVLHGYIPADEQNLAESLRISDIGQRMILSTKMLPSSEIAALVASSEIGLVFYSSDTQNEYLTGRSSEKAALYARAGVPMIAFAYPSFLDVFSQYSCGRCIQEMTEITRNIQQIFEDYNTYREGALRAYQDVYEFSEHFSGVVDWLEQIAPS